MAPDATQHRLHAIVAVGPGPLSRQPQRVPSAWWCRPPAVVRQLVEGARRDALLQVSRAAEQVGASYQAMREAAQQELLLAKTRCRC